MTKRQKTEQVLAIVTDARHWYTKEEFLKMVKEVWNGLDLAQDAAVENVPEVPS